MTDTVVVTELTNGIVEVVVQGPQGPAGLGDVAAGGVLAGSYPNPTFAASPAFTGTPTAPTATAGTATTQIATTAFVGTAVDNLINAAPGALNTLDELAAALGDDANFATTVTNSLALKEATANKDASGGYAGLTLFKLNLKNAANTITSWFTTAATVARTWTMPDKDGTVAMTSDITGVNSGTNTGDQTTITGNAGTATALQTARTIGGSSFDGTANVTSFPSPGAIGGTTPAAGAFTTVSFSSTLTGSGSSAGVEVGAKGTANSPYIDFNSSGNSNDYDVRVQATGGTTVGTGNLNVTASLLAVSGTISATGITVATGLTATGANSGLDIGAKLSVNTPFIDFNSSGNSNDYDARLIASGGTTIGTGTLTYNGALFSVAGNLTATGNATLGDAEATDTHSIKGATTLLANSASAALTVTQTGAGNAFVVEDSASTDSTPFVIDGSGNLFKGYGSSISVEYPMGFQINGTGADAGVSMTRWAANTGSPSLYIAKSRGASVATRAIVLSGDSLASINFSGDDGTNFITGARVAAEVDGTPGTNDMPGRLVFSTTADGASSPTEAMRIDSKQNVGIGGAAPAYTKLSFAGTLASGSGFGRTVDAVGTVPSTTTTDHTVFQSNPYTQAAAFTLSALSHFVAVPGTFGAGSTVSNQFGFQAASNLTGATNNYGFYSNIASAANRYNFYAAGTADNVFMGAVGIGGSPGATAGLVAGKNMTGGTTAYSVLSQPQIQSDVTANAYTFYSGTNTAAAAFTLGNAVGFAATQAVIGAGSSITNQIGFRATSTLTGATNNYGFYSDIASGSNRWNFYSAGTADNFFAGSVGIGGTASAGQMLKLAKNITGATTSAPVAAYATVLSDVTTRVDVFDTFIATQATAFTLGALSHFTAEQATFGAGSTVTNQYGLLVTPSVSGATNNYGVFSNIASAANRYNFYAAGTATNYFAGPVTSSSYFSTSDVIGLKNATAIPAGGTFALGMSSTNTMGLYFGSGAPTVSAAKGSIYLRSDGTTTNDRMYVNTNGSTTWTAIVTVA